MTPDTLDGPTIIGLSGYARSGKDSAAAVLIGRGYVREAFADSLRRAVEALNPIVDHTEDGFPVTLADVLDPRQSLTERWEDYKVQYGSDSEGRRALQRLGTEVLRDTFGTAVHLLMLDKWTAEHDRLVVTDVRYPDEANAIRDRGGIILRVNRPGVGPVNAHATETAMDDYRWFAAVIDNDGTIADLHGRVLDACGLSVYA